MTHPSSGHEIGHLYCNRGGRKMKFVTLLICCVSVLIYYCLPIWQLVAAFDVIAICISLFLETVGKEIKEEIMEVL